EYRYDPWGNLIEKRSGHCKLQHFIYDCENRLVRAETLVNGKLDSQGEYRYDSLGRRIAKQAEMNGEVEQKRFLWQGLRMLREETPGHSILYLYEPGSYAPLARVDQVEGEEQKVYYFHTDQIGTPLELTNSDGAVVWQATYRSWGMLEQLDISEVEQNLRFQGQYFDVESELHYNTFRYYASDIGRFVTQDPLGLGGGVNIYQYAPNATAWIDPWGLSFKSVNFEGSPELFPVTGNQKISYLFKCKGLEVETLLKLTSKLVCQRLRSNRLVNILGIIWMISIL
ncbi:RHS repeat domain-containing protein, partial [Pseudomonas sp. CJQ_7]